MPCISFAASNPYYAVIGAGSPLILRHIREIDEDLGAGGESMMSQMLSKATDSKTKTLSHISIFPATQRPKGDGPRLVTLKTIAPSDEEKCRKFAINKYRYI